MSKLNNGLVQIYAPKFLAVLAKNKNVIVGTLPFLNRKGKKYNGYFAMVGQAPRSDEPMYRINIYQFGDLVQKGAVNFGILSANQPQ